MPTPPSDPEIQGGPTPAPQPTGLTRFLVESPSSAGISREQLVEAVRALIRERDYLREVREVLVSDYEAELLAHRQHANELEEAQALESRAHDLQNAELKGALEAHQAEIDALLAERMALLEDRERWRRRSDLGVLKRWGGKLRAFVGLSPPGVNDDRPPVVVAPGRSRAQDA